MTSFRGRKFCAFAIAVGALLVGARWGQVANFGGLAAAIVATFGTFAGAHTITDIKAGRSGEAPRG